MAALQQLLLAGKSVSKSLFVFNFETESVGDQTIIDGSPHALNGSSLGALAAVSNVQAKFGSQSTLFKATSQYGFGVGPDVLLNYATTDEWTFGVWVYITTWVAGTWQFMSYGNAVSRGWVGLTGVGGAPPAMTWNWGAGGTPTGLGTVPLATWTYLELNKQNDGNLKAFIDGTFDADITSGAGKGSVPSPALFTLGGYAGHGAGTDNGMRIYLDSAFLVPGVLHTANFTRPSSPSS